MTWPCATRGKLRQGRAGVWAAQRHLSSSPTTGTPGATLGPAAPAPSIAPAPLRPSPPARCQPNAHPRLRGNACWCGFHGALIASPLSPRRGGGKQVIFSNHPAWKESPRHSEAAVVGDKMGLVPACVRPSIPATASQQSQHCAALEPGQRVPRTREQRGADAGTTRLPPGAEMILPSPSPILPISSSRPGSTDPSHTVLQAGTSTLCILSILNQQTVAVISHEPSCSPDTAGKRRGAPWHTQSSCTRVHACSCMRMQTAQTNNKATGAAAALGSELPHHTRIKQALGSILKMVSLVRSFVLIHVTAWFTFSQRSHTCWCMVAAW